MAQYNFNEELKNRSSSEIWDICCNYIISNMKFYSITGIEYKANMVGDSIFYKGSRKENTNRNINGEEITKEEFLEAVKFLMSLKNFNTSSIRYDIPKFMYAKRTPLFGILLSARIIQ